VANSGTSRWVVALVLVGGIAAGGFVLVRALIQRQDRLAELQTHVPELMKVTPRGDAAGAPYVTGRLIVIDSVASEIEDEIYFGLPPALRARRADEVGTVVLLTWQMKPYTDPNTGRSEGNVDTCELTAMDRSTGLVTARHTITGRPGAVYPQSQGTRDRVARSGVTPVDRGASARPYKDVADYLASLPRR
jgi:hypothetical protein